MHTHEYQAKALLRNYNIPIADWRVVQNAEELGSAVAEMNLTGAVLKIQVHAGGRGKGGGVVLAESPEAIAAAGERLLGMRLTNNQTGPRGVIAKEILITPIVKYVKEGYLAVTIDRGRGSAIMLASPAGGMEIEEVARLRPQELVRLPLPANGILRSYHKLALKKCMGWSDKTATQGIELAQNLIRAFLESDALLLEINPLVEDSSGNLIALDAKWTIDDDALFRHPDYQGLFDPSQLPPTEVEARRYHLSYIPLEGNIGCMVNGAGLAMATMDIIKYAGGEPANFLDVGGGASVEKISAGFQLLLSDPQVKVILVNIFGGIMNCATIARGITSATEQQRIPQPLVVRMEGTNVEEGRHILSHSNLHVILAEDLADAAKKAVAL